MNTKDFQTIIFDKYQKILKVYVNEKSALLDTQHFKDAQYEIVQNIAIYQPQYLLINLQKLYFAITPEMQAWIVAEILPKIIESSVQKMGYVMPTAFVEQLSVEQIADDIAEAIEVEGKYNRIAYFKNEENVLEWFRINPNNLYNFV